MTIQWGDTGKAVVGPLKKFTVSLATPRETFGTGGSAISLGTVEPSSGGAGSISFTIQASDLPTITPSPLSVKYCAILFTAGQNLSGSTATINYSIYKTPNGGSQSAIATNQSQTGITNNLFWTHTHNRFFDVQVGDTLEIHTWANVTGVNLEYYGLMILPSRLELTKCPIVKDLSLTMATPTLSAAGATPNIQVTEQWNYYPSNSASYSAPFNGNVTMSAANIHAAQNGYSLGRLNRSDNSLATGAITSTTKRPQYWTNYYPTSISFREILR